MWEAGGVGGWGCGRLEVWEAGGVGGGGVGGWGCGRLVYKTRDARVRKGTVEGKTMEG